MRVQMAENVVCYDVDGTLVSENSNGGIFITNPNNQIGKEYTSHTRNIELLKAHHGRGFFVKVWSAAGWQWAETVVKALNLERYVNSVETKPTLLVDDLEVQEVFPARIFLKDPS